MAPNNKGRSEYGRGSDGDHITPHGQARTLSVSERARLMRRDGLRPDEVAGLSTPEDPHEYGIRIA